MADDHAPALVLHPRARPITECDRHSPRPVTLAPQAVAQLAGSATRCVCGLLARVGRDVAGAMIITTGQNPFNLAVGALSHHDRLAGSHRALGVQTCSVVAVDIHVLRASIRSRTARLDVPPLPPQEIDSIGWSGTRTHLDHVIPQLQRVAAGEVEYLALPADGTSRQWRDRLHQGVGSWSHLATCHPSAAPGARSLNAPDSCELESRALRRGVQVQAWRRCRQRPGAASVQAPRLGSAWRVGGLGGGRGRGRGLRSFIGQRVSRW